MLHPGALAMASYNGGHPHALGSLGGGGASQQQQGVVPLGTTAAAMLPCIPQHFNPWNVSPMTAAAVAAAVAPLAQAGVVNPSAVIRPAGIAWPQALLMPPPVVGPGSVLGPRALGPTPFPLGASFPFTHLAPHQFSRPSASSGPSSGADQQQTSQQSGGPPSSHHHPHPHPHDAAVPKRSASWQLQQRSSGSMPPPSGPVSSGRPSHSSQPAAHHHHQLRPQGPVTPPAIPTRPMPSSKLVRETLGAKAYDAVRSVMLRQQSTFVQQLFELHKLCQVQQLLVCELQAEAEAAEAAATEEAREAAAAAAASAAAVSAPLGSLLSSMQNLPRSIRSKAGTGSQAQGGGGGGGSSLVNLTSAQEVQEGGGGGGAAPSNTQQQQQERLVSVCLSAPSRPGLLRPTPMYLLPPDAEGGELGGGGLDGGGGGRRRTASVQPTVQQQQPQSARAGGMQDDATTSGLVQRKEEEGAAAAAAAASVLALLGGRGGGDGAVSPSKTSPKESTTPQQQQQLSRPLASRPPSFNSGQPAAQPPLLPASILPLQLQSLPALSASSLLFSSPLPPIAASAPGVLPPSPSAGAAVSIRPSTMDLQAAWFDKHFKQLQQPHKEEAGGAGGGQMQMQQGGGQGSGDAVATGNLPMAANSSMQTELSSGNEEGSGGGKGPSVAAGNDGPTASGLADSSRKRAYRYGDELSELPKMNPPSRPGGERFRGEGEQEDQEPSAIIMPGGGFKAFKKPRASRKARSNAGSNRLSMGRKSVGGGGGPHYESDDDSGTESVALHQQRQQLQQQHSANLASALVSPAHSGARGQPQNLTNSKVKGSSGGGRLVSSSSGAPPPLGWLTHPDPHLPMGRGGAKESERANSAADILMSLSASGLSNAAL